MYMINNNEIIAARLSLEASQWSYATDQGQLAEMYKRRIDLKQFDLTEKQIIILEKTRFIAFVIASQQCVLNNMADVVTLVKEYTELKIRTETDNGYY